MISFFSVGSAGDAARYHDKAFARDGHLQADNYYLNEQSAAHWQGKGAEVLGWAGQPVTKEQFVAALEGRLLNPATGQMQDLAENSVGDRRRAGMDLTISPPKSVSIVALVGQDERVVAAHQAANARAMTWLEEHAAVVRVRHNGIVSHKQAGNLLYATVVHETDRANQPQLHSHNVVAAVVYDKDSGKWRSLTNDTLLVLRAKADVVYKAELAQGLRTAGYHLDYAANGVDFEIQGVKAEHIAAYSTRSAQIKEALAARGIDPESASFEARQTAALDSRARKREVPRDVLHEVWQQTAREAGLDLGSLVSRAREHKAETEQERGAGRAAMQAVAWGIDHLSEREQTFKRKDLEIAALQFGGRLTIDQAQSAIATHVANGQLTERGDDGRPEALLTTAKAMHAERSLIGDIQMGRGQNNVILAEEKAFERGLAEFEAKKSKETGWEFRLSDEQRNAARNVLMHADSYQGIQGEAGTGKTAALAMVRDVTEAQGWQVIGMATSASAAKELQASSGIASQTVAGFFVERENAIRLAKLQISELEASLAHGKRSQPANTDAAQARGPLPAVAERERVRVETGDVSFGASHYVFDHRRGEVFRAGTGFAALVGNFLMDTADAAREAAGRGSRATASSRFEANALLFGAAVADLVGQRLARFEQVGLVEAAMAKSVLYQQRGSDQYPSARALAIKYAELANLERFGNREGKKTLLVMDEASLAGAQDAARVSSLARSIGARVVFQGDTKQHGSVPAGRAFAQAQKAGMNTSMLQETRRFDRATPQVRQALQAMKQGRFGDAIMALDNRVVAEDGLARAVAERYLANLEELRAKGIAAPKVGIVALTNDDRKSVNRAVHEALVEGGEVSQRSFTKLHLDDPKLTAAERLSAGMIRAAGVDRLVFRQNYRELGIAKDQVVWLVGFDAERNHVIVESAAGKTVAFNPQQFERFSAARAESREFAMGDAVEARANLKFGDKTTERVTNGSRGRVSTSTSTAPPCGGPRAARPA